MEDTQTAPTTALRLDAATQLRRVLSEPGASLRPAVVAELLDSMGHAERVRAVRTLGRKEQSALWHAIDGFAPVTLLDIVPSRRGSNEEVRHFGKNSLPLFTRFEKRFCRPDGQSSAHPDELHGYNYQASRLATWFSGPGYFIATEDKGRGEVLIDYRRVPAAHPPSWPEIRSNERGGARLVYGFMVDTLRRVSAHVTLGRANRRGKDVNAWFLLCRDASDETAGGGT